MNSMDNSVPSEGENHKPSTLELDLDKIEDEAYKWVVHTFDTDKLTKDQIIELVKLHMRKHVYQLQFQMVLEKYQGTVAQYEEIARRLDNIDVLKIQAAE
jgi:O6-methylguanine-DNA--protein-cysteine methyltransferase